MLYEKLTKLSNADFKRYCGVPKQTFDKMCAVVCQKSALQRLIAGRPSKLAVADQVLLTLEYWRQYRTQFHIAKSWGLSESTVSRIIVRIEDILSSSGEFDLPGKRFADLPPEVEVVVVDVTESPLERPKKNNDAIIRARKSDTR